MIGNMEIKSCNLLPFVSRVSFCCCVPKDARRWVIREMLDVTMTWRRRIDKWHLWTCLWLFSKLCLRYGDLVQSNGQSFCFLSTIPHFHIGMRLYFCMNKISVSSLTFKNQTYVKIPPAVIVRNSAFCPYTVCNIRDIFWTTLHRLRLNLKMRHPR
jgi:hypothetical protein